MEDNKNGGYSAEGRKLRPRKKVSFAEGESRSDYGHRDNERYNGQGERRSSNYGERRPYGEGGERRSYGGNSYNNNRSGDRPYRSGGEGGYRGGEHRSYGEGDDRRRYNSNGEHRNYNNNGGERRPYNNGGERRGYDNGGQRSYNNGERRGYNNGERRSYGEGGERRNYGEQRGYNGGERRSYGENGEQRSYNGGGRKPYNGGGRKPYGQGGYNKSRKGGYKRSEPGFDESPDSGIYRMIERRPGIDASAYSDNDYVKTPIQNEIRLNKFIANSGVCSRREADTFIQAGVVTVNGEVVTELGTKVNVLTDDVRFNGERLRGEEKVYIVMNKPKGYVTTASDPHASKTVMDLLKGCGTRVFPVGRLDKATTGVLMFTNDGEIAERLTHPSYDKKKIYQVLLDRELSQEDHDKIAEGIELSDGTVAADELEYIDANDHRRLGIEIHSGKNRIVRRIFESLGYNVKALDRVYFAGLTKKGLNKGEWRYLTEGEVNILKMGAYV